VVTVAAGFAAAAGGAFFVVLGAAEAAAGGADTAPAAVALVEFELAAVDAGAVAGLLGVVAIDPEAANGADALTVSFFAVFTGSAGIAGLDPVVADAGALLAVGAAADVTAVSVLPGFGGATGFSAAGSGFFSLSDFADASDMLMMAT